MYVALRYRIMSTGCMLNDFNEWRNGMMGCINVTFNQHWDSQERRISDTMLYCR